MSKTESNVEQKPRSNALRLLIMTIIAAAVLLLIGRNIEKLGYILMVVFGFGGVVLVHEFGHFIVAKMCGIRVDAFSIGFSPVLLGILRTADGIRLRILPTLVPRGGEDPDELGALCLTIPWKGKAHETEYRLGLIPFGGFVKMLGQEDAGVAEANDDPRSFLNKSLGKRIAVVMAGVTFNVISALIIFMVVFSQGIRLPAPVVGDVVPGSPAFHAGLQGGDRIESIDGKTFIDFSNVMFSAVLAGKEEVVPMRVRRQLEGGEQKVFEVAMKPRVPAQDSMKIRAFGFSPALTLEIESLDEESQAELFEKTRLLPGDRIVAAGGQKVGSSWEFFKIAKNTLGGQLAVTVERPVEGAGVTTAEGTIPLTLVFGERDFGGNFSMTSAHTMVPPLVVDSLEGRQKKRGLAKVQAWVMSQFGIQEETKAIPAEELHPGDILVQVGDVEYPTFPELRKAMSQYGRLRAQEEAGETVAVKVLRGTQELELQIKPVSTEASDPNETWLLGIVATPTGLIPMVGKTIDMPGGPKALDIPMGATITAIDGQTPKTFYDVMQVIRDSAGRSIVLDWSRASESGSVTLEIPDAGGTVTLRSVMAVGLPLGSQRDLFRADGPLQAIWMGWDRTKLFLGQAYVTVVRLFSGLLGTKALSGPVGIVGATYKIAESRPLADFFYWLGLISAMIAVMNLLPLPILDGGVIVMMVIAKIKGSPISDKVQAAIAYAGLAALLALMVYVTWNDIANLLR